MNGFNAHPVWRYLKQQQSNGFLLGDDIPWNFAKFLVGRDGKVIKRFGPPTSPADIEKDILEALEAPTKLGGVVTPTGTDATAPASAA